MEAPRLLHIVQQVKEDNPVAWRNCHRKVKPDEAAEEFIRICAWRMHKIDPKFGLVGQYGRDRIAQDAVGYKSNRHPADKIGGLEVIDVVFAAGAEDDDPNRPAPQWIDQTQATLDKAVRHKWIKPAPLFPIPDPAPLPTPAPPIVPTPPTGNFEEQLKALDMRLQELEAWRVRSR